MIHLGNCVEEITNQCTGYEWMTASWHEAEGHYCPGVDLFPIISCPKMFYSYIYRIPQVVLSSYCYIYCNETH